MEGRLVKGKLEDGFSHGILARRWNQWVDKDEDGGVLAGVQAGRIDCYTESHGYRTPRKRGGPEGQG